MPVMYARSDIASINIGEGHGGCGQPHVRETGPDGLPVTPFSVSCPQCTEFLRTSDHWSSTIAEIPETFDEAKGREFYEKRGVKDRDALLALALARMSGVSSAEIPDSVRKMVAGVPAHVPGIVLCPTGHDNMPGSRFCRECGSGLGGRALASVPS